MADSSLPEPDYATAVHEAGHSVAAILNGLEVHKVSVIPVRRPDGQIGLGYSEIDYPRWQKFINRGESAVFPILVTFFAGSLAEDSVYHNVSSQPYSFKADSDMADLYAGAALRPAVMPTDPSQIAAVKTQVTEAVKTLCGRAITEAERFVQAHHAVIIEVADTLMAKGELTGEEIRHIMSTHLQ